MNKGSNLDELRQEIRRVTVEILRLTGRRLSLAKRIGETKRQRGLPIKNLEAERELKRVILEKCQVYNVDSRFGLKLLNLLIDEAKRVQREIGEGSQNVGRNKENRGC